MWDAGNCAQTRDISSVAVGTCIAVCKGDGRAYTWSKHQQLLCPFDASPFDAPQTPAPTMGQTQSSPLHTGSHHHHLDVLHPVFIILVSTT